MVLVVADGGAYEAASIYHSLNLDIPTMQHTFVTQK